MSRARSGVVRRSRDKPNPLIAVLERHGNALATFAPLVNLSRFVLKHGREFQYQPKPDKYRQGKPQQCWFNSALLALEHGLIYVEGYAAVANLLIPLHHAWCVEPGSSAAIEVTSPLFTYYIGICFRPEFIRARTIEQFPILDNWQSEWAFEQLSEAELAEAVFKTKEKAYGRKAKAT